MKRTVTWLIAAVLIGGVASPAALAAPSADPKPFVTSARAELVALTGGLTITPILTAGDVVRGAKDRFQFTGVPDGIGVYRSAAGRLEVFINHELSARYGDPSDARISHIALNPSGEVVGAGYVVDGTEGYEWFCSGSMGSVAGTPWYFTGEEWPATKKQGMAIGVNAVTERVHQLRQFGRISHEQVIQVPGMSRAAFFLSEDARAPRSQIYGYFSDSFAHAVAGRGTFRTWVPDRRLDGDPSPADIAKGQALRGHFVTIPHAGALSGVGLDAAAQRLHAMDFSRIEDAQPDPAHPGVVYFADTGSYGQETQHGRIYRLRMDPSHPTRATLRVVLDGDHGDALRNPDNLGISDRALVIQEDRNAPHSGYNRVLVYDLAAHTLTPVARTDPTAGAIKRAGGRGAWESSGVVDVSNFFGQGWWLVDVQAHHTKVDQQGLSLRIDSGRGEGGQLLLMQIPGT